MSDIHALIIDDHVDNLDVLDRLLALNGVSSSAVMNVAELESVVAQLAKIDVVFLDLELPKHSGYEVLEILRGLLPASVPVIACTVHSNEIDRARAFGFDGFIGKPINPALFPHQLQEILQGNAVWEAV
ncbi:MAG: response regulator [Anaerolineae bacterium]|nr:response regulator [Anaerolineae bacterium]